MAQEYIQSNGVGNSSAYMVSAIPFVSASIAVPASGSSPIVVQFGQVTKFVTIKNSGAETIRVGFSERGLTTSNNYVLLGTGESYTGDWKIVRLYARSHTGVVSTLDVVAGLTTIRGDYLSSNWSGSLGVG